VNSLQRRQNKKHLQNTKKQHLSLTRITFKLFLCSSTQCVRPTETFPGVNVGRIWIWPTNSNVCSDYRLCETILQYLDFISWIQLAISNYDLQYFNDGSIW